MNRRRTTTVAVAAVLTVGAAAAAVVAVRLPDAAGGEQKQGGLPAATAEVTKQTLVDRQDKDGTLAYGDTSTVAAKQSGTVTSLPAADSTAVPLAPELDSAALIGWPAAADYLGFDGHPTTVYTRPVESQVEAVRAVLPATANPQSPSEVKVSRPSDALAARRATDRTFTALLLGLGAVALLVGGIGVANTMVISVLERRSEIGLRRSLGATRAQIRTQFVWGSLLLSLLGGVAGVLIGFAVMFLYAWTQSWPTVVPPWAPAGGVGATLAIGAIAGLYPAIRAARLAPTEALGAA
jgi:hypothetical protein